MGGRGELESMHTHKELWWDAEEEEQEGVAASAASSWPPPSPKSSTSPHAKLLSKKNGLPTSALAAREAEGGFEQGEAGSQSGGGGEGEESAGHNAPEFSDDNTYAPPPATLQQALSTQESTRPLFAHATVPVPATGLCGSWGGWATRRGAGNPRMHLYRSSGNCTRTPDGPMCDVSESFRLQYFCQMTGREETPYPPKSTLTPGESGIFEPLVTGVPLLQMQTILTR